MAAPRRLSSFDLSSGFIDLPAGPLAVALSGGADSAAAALASVETGRPVRAIHIDHGRPASSWLASRAEAIAERLGIGLQIVELEPGPVFGEGRARELRYAALLAALGPDEQLVTGHTADDVAETVVMNLARGSGLDGLAGIPRIRGNIIRPMLGFRRSVTREAATLAGLPWMDDPDNADARFVRNRVRRQLLTGWEAVFGPATISGLIRTASTAGAESGFLDDLARSAIQPPVPVAGGGVALVAGELVAVAPAVAARAVRSALRPLFGDRNPGSSAVASLLRVAAGEARSLDLGSGWSAVASPPMVEVVRATSGPGALPEVQLLDAAPGTFRWGDWSIETWLGPEPDVWPMTKAVMAIPDGVTPVVLRGAGDDDVVPVAGGSAPVGEALAAAGVPTHHRESWPVVVVAGRVVWIPGVRRVATGPEPGASSSHRRPGRYLWILADRGKQ